MGLAAAKNRKKWSKDPNNTKWSRNTDSFGQKMLRSQGWEPGQYLGAQDAPHTEFLTAASASHIRAVLKDDNLGLGAKRNQGDECTGLDAFQQLLGRLNGKSEEVLETEQKIRSDLKMNMYIERKVGSIRFVRGGWLVGDQVRDLIDKTAKEAGQIEGPDATDVSEGTSDSTRKKERKSKKRKVSEDAAEEDEEKSKSARKESKRRKTAEKSSSKAVEGSEEKSERKRKRKEKERSKKDDMSPSLPVATTENLVDESRAETEADDEDGAASARKEKSRKKDKSKKSRKTAEVAGQDIKDERRLKKRKKRKDGDASDLSEDIVSAASTPVPTGASTPTESGVSTPRSDATGRHLARKRFIAQKRLAVMDPQALNQIFMIKT